MILQLIFSTTGRVQTYRALCLWKEILARSSQRRHFSLCVPPLLLRAVSEENSSIDGKFTRSVCYYLDYSILYSSIYILVPVYTIDIAFFGLLSCSSPPPIRAHVSFSSWTPNPAVSMYEKKKQAHKLSCEIEKKQKSRVVSANLVSYY